MKESLIGQIFKISKQKKIVLIQKKQRKWCDVILSEKTCRRASRGHFFRPQKILVSTPPSLNPTKANKYDTALYWGYCVEKHSGFFLALSLFTPEARQENGKSVTDRHWMTVLRRLPREQIFQHFDRQILCLLVYSPIEGTRGKRSAQNLPRRLSPPLNLFASPGDENGKRF